MTTLRQQSLFKRKNEKPVLRPYQTQGIEEMRNLISSGILRICLTMPTGGGKTVVAANIIELALALGKRVLFVVHRIELINQAVNQLGKLGIDDIGVIRADDRRTDASARIQVASIDTLRNRERPAADIIFIDECHRAASDSYRSLFTDFPKSLHIGLTATPFRGDNRGLGELYQSIVVCAKPSQLIADGFILEPHILAAPVMPDVSSVEFSEAVHDYHNGQLANTMMKSQLLGNIVEEWKKHAQGRRTVVFAVNVEHSIKIAESFAAEGIRCVHLDGKTSDSDRIQALLRLEKYEIQIITNCDVLSEGWDQPSVKCVILARPTASLRMHLQQCGRILRPWGNDVFCDAPTSAVILDHAGNCYRHGLPQWDRQFDLQTGDVRKEKLTLHTCEKCYTLWSGSSRVCPECRYEMPKDERKAIQHDESVQLAPIKLVMNKADEERNFFLRELTKCRDKGMKPGAAAHKFKEKYNKWPPYAWSTQSKQMFAQDEEWQKAVNRRSENRNWWQQHQSDKEAVNAVANAGTGVRDEGFTEEPQEDKWWEQFETGRIDDDDIPF